MKILQSVTLEAEAVLAVKEHCSKTGMPFSRFMNDALCKALIDNGIMTQEQLVAMNKRSAAMGGRPRLTQEEKYARAKAKLDAQYIRPGDPRHPAYNPDEDA